MDRKRYMCLVAVAAVAGLAGGLASGWILRTGEAFADKGAPSAKVLQAERIEVVDRNGKPCAWLEVDDSGNPGLYLVKGGCVVASFGLVGDGKPRIDLGDGCYPRAVLSLDAGGVPHLVLSDRDGKPRVNLGLPENGGAILSVRGKDGKVAWAAPESGP